MDTLNKWLTFISNIGVLIGVIFVGYELRQNTIALGLTSSVQSQESLAAFNEQMSLNPLIAGIFLKASEAGSRSVLSEVESMQLAFSWRAMAQRIESIYFSYEAGVLDSRIWEVRRSWLAGFIELPIVQEWWEEEKNLSTFTPEFIADIEAADAANVGEDGLGSGF